jgi:hypothetical protein
MPARSPTNAQVIEALRVRRAEPYESLSALEQALAAPAPGRMDAWAERVHVVVVELASDFKEHIAIAEGPNGVYRGVLSTTPRLSDAVARLTRDHAEVDDLIQNLLTCVGATPVSGDVGAIRDLGTALLVRLIRSRQRSTALVYEAYQSDIGAKLDRGAVRSPQRRRRGRPGAGDDESRVRRRGRVRKSDRLARPTPSAVARRARRAHDEIGRAPGRVRPQAASGRLQVIGPDRAEWDFEGTRIS